MTLRCLISDCTWSEGTLCKLGTEELIEQHCIRCGSLRYLQVLDDSVAPS